MGELFRRHLQRNIFGDKSQQNPFSDMGGSKALPEDKDFNHMVGQWQMYFQNLTPTESDNGVISYTNLSQIEKQIETDWNKYSAAYGSAALNKYDNRYSQAKDIIDYHKDVQNEYAMWDLKLDKSKDMIQNLVAFNGVFDVEDLDGNTKDGLEQFVYAKPEYQNVPKDKVDWSKEAKMFFLAQVSDIKQTLRDYNKFTRPEKIFGREPMIAQDGSEVWRAGEGYDDFWSNNSIPTKIYDEGQDFDIKEMNQAIGWLEQEFISANYQQTHTYNRVGDDGIMKEVKVPFPISESEKNRVQRLLDGHIDWNTFVDRETSYETNKQNTQGIEAIKGAAVYDNHFAGSDGILAFESALFSAGQGHGPIMVVKSYGPGSKHDTITNKLISKPGTTSGGGTVRTDLGAINPDNNAEWQKLVIPGFEGVDTYTWERVYDDDGGAKIGRDSSRKEYITAVHSFEDVEGLIKMDPDVIIAINDITQSGIDIQKLIKEYNVSGLQKTPGESGTVPEFNPTTLGKFYTDKSALVNQLMEHGMKYMENTVDGEYNDKGEWVPSYTGPVAPWHSVVAGQYINNYDPSIRKILDDDIREMYGVNANPTPEDDPFQPIKDEDKDKAIPQSTMKDTFEDLHTGYGYIPNKGDIPGLDYPRQDQTLINDKVAEDEDREKMIMWRTDLEMTETNYPIKHNINLQYDNVHGKEVAKIIQDGDVDGYYSTLYDDIEDKFYNTSGELYSDSIINDRIISGFGQYKDESIKGRQLRRRMVYEYIRYRPLILKELGKLNSENLYGTKNTEKAFKNNDVYRGPINWQNGFEQWGTDGESPAYLDKSARKPDIDEMFNYVISNYTGFDSADSVIKVMTEAGNAYDADHSKRTEDAIYLIEEKTNGGVKVKLKEGKYYITAAEFEILNDTPDVWNMFKKKSSYKVNNDGEFEFKFDEYLNSPNTAWNGLRFKGMPHKQRLEFLKDYLEDKHGHNFIKGLEEEPIPPIKTTLQSGGKVNENQGNKVASQNTNQSKSTVSGSKDVGLWQFNQHYHPDVEEGLSVQKQAQFLANKLKEGTSWDIWTSVQNGAHKQYLGLSDDELMAPPYNVSKQILQTINKFIPAEHQDMAKAVMFAESSGQPNALNINN